MHAMCWLLIMITFVTVVTYLSLGVTCMYCFAISDLLIIFTDTQDLSQ